jgi:hypothetical protein
MGKLPATLSITTNPTGYMATAGAIYAGVAMAYNAYNHHGAWSTPVFIALAGAVASLLTRQIVTPVTAPRDGAGNPLVPAPAMAGPAAQPGSGSVRVVPQPVGAPVAAPDTAGEPPAGVP